MHETRERPLLDASSAPGRARRRSTTRKPVVEDGTITIPLVPPARTEAGIHTRLTMVDSSVDVSIDYDAKDVRVSIRRHVEVSPVEPVDQMALFTKS